MGPNEVAYAALLIWPIVAGVLFALLPLRVALPAAIIGGLLLLPEKTQFNLPMLPSYDKALAAALAALVFCVIHERRRGDSAQVPGWAPRSSLFRVLAALFLFTPALTVMANGDPLFYGDRIVPGLRLYDAGNAFYLQATALLPFLLARRYLGDPDGQKTLLRVFVVAAMAYSLPILIELRLSPQLHKWVYGFYPFSFAQAVRGGGFRPTVFFQHGLWLATFVTMALVGAGALWRLSSGRDRILAMAATGWLGLILLMSNSFGALLIGMALTPVALFMGPWIRRLTVVSVAVLALLYPMLRSVDVLPVQRLAAVVTSIDERRGGSLQHRLNNEDVLLAKASERPLLGWGRWGRSRVFDPVTGNDISTTDGRWVILFGWYGWIGYLAEFGLLTLPLVLLVARRRRLGADGATIALSLMLCVNLLDLLPNTPLLPITWLLAGAILGRVEYGAARATQDVAPAHDALRSRAVLGNLATPRQAGASAAKLSWR